MTQPRSATGASMARMRNSQHATEVLPEPTGPQMAFTRAVERCTRTAEGIGWYCSTSLIVADLDRVHRARRAVAERLLHCALERSADHNLRDFARAQAGGDGAEVGQQLIPRFVDDQGACLCGGGPGLHFARVQVTGWTFENFRGRIEDI